MLGSGLGSGSGLDRVRVRVESVRPLLTLAESVNVPAQSLSSDPSPSTESRVLARLWSDNETIRIVIRFSSCSGNVGVKASSSSRSASFLKSEYEYSRCLRNQGSKIRKYLNPLVYSAILYFYILQGVVCLHSRIVWSRVKE